MRLPSGARSAQLVALPEKIVHRVVRTIRKVRFSAANELRPQKWEKLPKKSSRIQQLS